MTVAWVTDDFAYDPLHSEYVPSGVTFYRCVVPLSVVGGMIGRPRFSPREGIGIGDITDPTGEQEALYGFGTIVVKLVKSKSFLKWISLAKELGQRIVVDVDDAFNYLHPTNSAYEMTDPEKNKGVNREWMERIALAADTITVSTPFLRDHYMALHPDVRMVRNAILPSMFDQRRQESKPIIGWVGALAWRSEDLETMRGWLPKFIADNHLRFHHSGHHEDFAHAVDLIGIPRKGSSSQGMAPMSRLRQLFTMDIGLVPLNDIPFNHAKSYLKGLEYAAAGIPFVASDLPEYRMLAEQGVGQVAVSDDDWTEKMTALLPKKARVAAAEAARDTVLTHHTVSNRKDEWISAITVPQLLEVRA